MKLKTIILFLVAVCGFTGCADARKQLVGSWMIAHITDARGNDSQLPTNDPDPLIFRFFSNGTFSMTIPQEGGETHFGRYAIRGQQLVMSDTNNLQSSSFTYKLSNDELVLPAAGGGLTMFFKRMEIK